MAKFLLAEECRRVVLNSWLDDNPNGPGCLNRPDGRHVVPCDICMPRTIHRFPSLPWDPPDQAPPPPNHQRPLPFVSIEYIQSWSELTSMIVTYQHFATCPACFSAGRRKERCERVNDNERLNDDERKCCIHGAIFLRESPPFIPSTSEAFSEEYVSAERTSDLEEPAEPELEPVADEDSYAQYDETRDDEYEEYEGDMSSNDDSESGDEAERWERWQRWWRRRR
jgi:hypothetical protein